MSSQESTTLEVHAATPARTPSAKSMQSWYDQFLQVIRDRANLVTDPPLPSQFGDGPEQFQAWALQFSAWRGAAHVPDFEQIHWQEEGDRLEVMTIGKPEMTALIPRADWNDWLSEPANQLDQLLTPKELVVLSANVMQLILAEYLAVVNGDGPPGGTFMGLWLWAGLPTDLAAVAEYGNVMISSMLEDDFVFNALTKLRPIDPSHSWNRSWIVFLITIHTNRQEYSRLLFWKERIQMTPEEQVQLIYGMGSEAPTAIRGLPEDTSSTPESDDEDAVPSENQVRVVQQMLASMVTSDDDSDSFEKD